MIFYKIAHLMQKNGGGKPIRLRAFSTIVVLLFMAGCTGMDNNIWPSDEFSPKDCEHFDAEIDGSHWYPQERLFGPRPVMLKYLLSSTNGGSGQYFSMEIIRDSKPESALTVTLDSIQGIGSYSLGDSSKGVWASYWFVDTIAKKNPTYITNILRTGVIVITQIDTVKRLISGTINFDAASGNATIHVRKGDFKIGY